MKTIEELEQLHPCSEGLDWAKRQSSLYVAWETCQRGDWMWWLLKQLRVKKEISVSFANFCALRAKNHAATATATYAATCAAADAAAFAAIADAASDAYAAADAAAFAAANAVFAAFAADDEKARQADFIRTRVTNPFESHENNKANIL